MRPPARILLLVVAALAVFGGVVAIQLYRMEIARASCSRPRADAPAERPPAVLLAAAGSPAERGLAASRGAPVDPPRPSRPTLTIRLELGTFGTEALACATIRLRILGADGVEGEVRAGATHSGAAGWHPDASGVTAGTRSQGLRTDVVISGLPPGPTRALALVVAGPTVLGLSDPISIGVDVMEATLEVVPADRLGTVVADVRRDGKAFGPAALVVRAGGLVVGEVGSVRGRARPVLVPAGTPIEVSLSSAPASEELGLPSPREVTLAPRETKDLAFDLDDGIPFSIRAIGPDGHTLSFEALAWREVAGLGPRRAPGLLLTSGVALEHRGIGPVGEISVLVIPTRVGAPTWVHASLAGRTIVPIDARVGLSGGVVELRLGDAEGRPRAGWAVELVRTDAVDLPSFATWSGSADAEGHVISPPLPAGTYRLEVGGRFVRAVTLPEAGLTLTLVVPPMPSGGGTGPALEVSMTDSDGAPRAIASAYVLPEGDGWGQRLEPRRDEPGRFHAATLSAGRFRVVVPWTWGAGPRHGTVEVPVTLLGEGVFHVDVVVPQP